MMINVLLVMLIVLLAGQLYVVRRIHVLKSEKEFEELKYKITSVEGKTECLQDHIKILENEIEDSSARIKKCENMVEGYQEWLMNIERREGAK